MSTRVRLEAIVFDAGTQIRASIDQQVVSDYAEAMTNGAVFPPIVLFHDGTRHYLADGFHRFLAAQRIQWRELEADVRPGTKEDALWFALGANRTNGKRLTDGDKKHAILLALAAWPGRSANQIAEQIGVNAGYFSRVKAQHVKDNPKQHVEDRVIGKDGKTYPASSPKPSRPVSPQRQAATELVQQGLSSKAIHESAGVSFGTIAAARRDLGVSGVDTSKAAVQSRRDQLREMADEGHSSRQIAAAIGLTETRTRELARKLNVEIPADKVIGRSKRHDSNRIIERIVMDAENLTEGVDLVDFADIDRSRLAEWLTSLQRSRDKLGAFIRRLMKEQQNGEAA